jgi:hypothetical protein
VTLRSSCRHICKEYECYKQQKALHLPKVVTTVARVMLTRFFRGLAGMAPALLAKGRKNLWKTKKGMQMDSKDASRCCCTLWLVAAILMRAALKQGKQVDIRTTNIPDQEGVARAEASICVHRVGAEMVQDVAELLLLHANRRLSEPNQKWIRKQSRRASLSASAKAQDTREFEIAQASMITHAIGHIRCHINDVRLCALDQENNLF